MSTAIQMCPPHDAIGAIRYKPQYHREKMLPVHLPEHNTDGTFERGLGFDDYSRCNIYTHLGGARVRILSSPEWSQNDCSMRAVVLRYMEQRDQRSNMPKLSSERERFVRVFRKMKEQSARLLVIIDRACNELVAHRSCESPFCIRRRKSLELQIKMLDGRLILSHRPDVFYDIAVDYYRVRLTSTEIASKLGISSVCVRQILSRLNRVARELGFEAPRRLAVSPEVQRMRKHQLDAYRAARAEEKKRRAEAREASRQYQMIAISKKPSAPKTPKISAPKTPRKLRHVGLTTHQWWEKEGRCRNCGQTKDREDRKMCASCRERGRVSMGARNERRKAERHARGLVSREVWRKHLSEAQKRAHARKKAENGNVAN